jgi:hypothetical protein
MCCRPVRQAVRSQLKSILIGSYHWRREEKSDTAAVYKRWKLGATAGPMCSSFDQFFRMKLFRIYSTREQFSNVFVAWFGKRTSPLVSPCTILLLLQHGGFLERSCSRNRLLAYSGLLLHICIYGLARVDNDALSGWTVCPNGRTPHHVRLIFWILI